MSYHDFGIARLIDSEGLPEWDVGVVAFQEVRHGFLAHPWTLDQIGIWCSWEILLQIQFRHLGRSQMYPNMYIGTHCVLYLGWTDGPQQASLSFLDMLTQF